MKNQTKKRILSCVVCIAILSLSAFAVCANSRENSIGRDIIREGENVLPDTDNGDVGDGILPTPDTDNGDVGDGIVNDPDVMPDKEDAKPDEDHDITNGNIDETAGRRFNYTGLIVTLIIAVAAVILIIIMIPGAKRGCEGSSCKRKK